MSDPNTKSRVYRNTIQLVFSQVVSVPVSIALNAFLARYLGAADFGQIYLATTFASLAFLLVDWGQISTLPARVVTDLQRAGDYLGTAVLWRLLGAVVVALVLLGGTYLLGYSSGFQAVLAIVLVSALLTSLISACQSVIIGFERTDIAAITQALQPILSALLVIPALLLGTRLLGVLGLQAVSLVLVLLIIVRALPRVGIGRPRGNIAIARDLFIAGPSFLAFALIVTLQGNIDAVYLSKLAPSEVVGWYAVAKKLVGTLVFPATALGAALYPTLARLAKTDSKEFNKVTADALGMTALVVMPVALGCALFPDIGVQIFSREGFRPAESNLRVLSLFVFLLYFTMTLGTVLLALNRQRAWAMAQFGCILVSLGLDPLLIPYFQTRFGNGGLGLSIASVISEALMTIAAFILCPKELFTGNLGAKLLFAALGGIAMGAVAFALSALPSLIAAALATLAYVIVLVAFGCVPLSQLRALQLQITRKLSRAT